MKILLHDTTTPRPTMKAQTKPGPGRPPKKPNELRSEVLNVTMTRNERRTLEKLAKQRGCTMNDVFRQALSLT
jgi:NRPS condensation-like uncharacterized protein